MTEQSQPQTGTTSKPQGQRDLRQEITDRMVQSLEQGQIPWRRPWENLEHGLPRNMATGNDYKGGNRFILQMTQLDQGYADPRFGTIKQINELGGRVNKGEHGHPIELWKDQPFWQRSDVRIVLDGQPVKVFGESRNGIDVGAINDKKASIRTRPEGLTVLHKGRSMSSWSSAHEILDRVVSKVYVVFNAEQCSGLNLEPLKVPDKLLPIERGEKLMQTMQKNGVVFKEHAEAFYSPAKDEIYMPNVLAFKDHEGFYGTALHEIGHATGAATRLNRDGITGGHKFGSESYAKEELRAELFSVFMAAETGIPHDEEQHKAYIQSWAKVLKEDKNEIFRAASDAGKAVDYVLDKERSLEMTQDHDLDESKNETVDISLLDAERASSGRESSAYEQAIRNFVRGGGNEKDGRRLLDNEMAGDLDPKNFPKALVHHGFAKPSDAEKLATTIVAEENRKIMEKEDRKTSQYFSGMQSDIDSLAKAAKPAGSTIAAVNQDGMLTVIAESQHMDLVSDKDRPDVKAPNKVRATRNKRSEVEMSR